MINLTRKELRSALRDLKTMKETNKNIARMQLFDLKHRSYLIGFSYGVLVSSFINGCFMSMRKIGVRGLVFVGCYHSMLKVADYGWHLRASDLLFKYFDEETKELKEMEKAENQNFYNVKFGTSSPMSAAVTQKELELSRMTKAERKDRKTEGEKFTFVDYLTRR